MIQIYKVLVTNCAIFLAHDPDVPDFSLNIIKYGDEPPDFVPYSSVFGPLTFKPETQISTLELLVLSGISEERLYQEYQSCLSKTYRTKHSEVDEK